jgi:hypothetical protein
MTEALNTWTQKVANTQGEVYEVRFGRTGRTHVPIFVYVIDDLEGFGRSIGNTGKRNGVMVFRSIDCNTGIPWLCVSGAVFAIDHLPFAIGDMPANHNVVKRHGAVAHQCVRLPFISGFT